VIGGSITSPLELLVKRVREFTMKGDSPQKIQLPAQAPAEVEQLVEDFDQMSVRLNESYTQLRAALLDRERLNAELHALLADLDVRGQLTGIDPVHQSLYLWSKTMLPNYILTVLGDRMEMANSIEGRVPFLDHHVV